MRIERSKSKKTPVPNLEEYPEAMSLPVVLPDLCRYCRKRGTAQAAVSCLLRLMEQTGKEEFGCDAFQPYLP